MMVHSLLQRLAPSVLPFMLALIMTASRVPVRAADPAEPLFRERWVYCSTNLLVNQNVDRVLDLVERARRSGYTTIMLADYKRPDREHRKLQPTTCYTVSCVKTAVEISEESQDFRRIRVRYLIYDRDSE